jgi:hypothetical protein
VPVFGQCWSTAQESDALWRIYSQFKSSGSYNNFFSRAEGVKLRATAKKLLDCLARGMGAKNVQKCYIGRVVYFEQAKLQQLVADAIGMYRDAAFSGIAGHADGLLLKRDAFQHEKEVRLLYIDSDREFEGREQIEVPIDVNNIIEEIELDPRIIGGGQARRSKWLQNKGFKNVIRRSMLHLGISMIVPLFRPEDLKKL